MNVFSVLAIVAVFGFLAWRLRVASSTLKIVEARAERLDADLGKANEKVAEINAKANDLATIVNKQAGVLAKSYIRNAKGQLQKFSSAYPKGL